MSDKVGVTLQVLLVHKDEVIKISEKIKCHFNEEWECSKHFSLYFSEVNYGELPELYILQKQGIAYNSYWASGDAFGAGTKFCRFTESGEVEVKEVYDTDRGVPTEDLLLHLEDHAKLKEIISLHASRTVPLPWDNQAEYGKRHLAKQLIAA